MRVLVISNFYPPYNVGGYELGCRDVAEGLRDLGHSVAVITSDYRCAVNGPNGVYRILHSSYGWPSTSGLSGAARLLYREVFDLRNLRSAIRRFRPDVIYVWSLASLSMSLLTAIERSGNPVVHFVSDESLTQWASDPWYALVHSSGLRGDRRRALSAVVSTGSRVGLTITPRRPDFNHLQFASDYLRGAFMRAGIGSGQSEVIHWGVADIWFKSTPAPRGALRLLCVGRLDPAKGIDTAIEAVGRLNDGPTANRVMLTIAGDASWAGHENYVRYLRNLVASWSLGDRVAFVGKIDRESMPEVYANHNVFLFTSVYQEPFSIALLEAMASSLAVVGTVTGGTAEVLEPERNALEFRPGDADGCARQLRRLAQQPGLGQSLGEEARRTVWARFRLNAMVKRIEQSLLLLLSSSSGRRQLVRAASVK